MFTNEMRWTSNVDCKLVYIQLNFLIPNWWNVLSEYLILIQSGPQLQQNACTLLQNLGHTYPGDNLWNASGLMSFSSSTHLLLLWNPYNSEILSHTYPNSNHLLHLLIYYACKAENSIAVDMTDETDIWPEINQAYSWFDDEHLDI